MPDAPVNNTPVPGSTGVAVLAPDFQDRCRLFDFLCLSYEGGVKYKAGYDSTGKRILIEHEQEMVDVAGGTVAEVALPNMARPTDAVLRNRYFRRQRIAAYENHVKPIIDKFAAYLLRNPAKRSDAVAADAPRMRLDEFVSAMVDEGLKMTETWVGVDAALPVAADGETPTQLQVEAADPVNKGKPYLVSADPRRVVDYDEDEKGNCLRAVILEVEVAKASFIAKPSITVRFKEWTSSGWKTYRTVGDDGNWKDYEKLPMLGDELKVREEASGEHTFGVCPWRRVKFPFPTEDVAELNRAIFNLGSLLDEELYQGTFTQKVIMGMNVEDVRAAAAGPGNFLVLNNPSVRVETISAEPTQAQNIQARITEVRSSLYRIVSMESSSDKNVAEAAEKKKRDMESLYTALVKIVGVIEDAENWLLERMGLVKNAEEAEEGSRSQYDRRFDVNSLADLLDDLKRLAESPMVTPSVKRAVAKQIAQKVDPDGDFAQHGKEIDAAVDLSPTVVDSITTLKAAGLLPPALAARMLGVPESERAQFEEAAAGHEEPMDEGDEGEGSEREAPDGEDDDQEGSGREGGAGGVPGGRGERGPARGAPRFGARAAGGA